MNDDVAAVARSAARELAGPLARSGLETEVVAALHARDTDHEPDQYADPVAIASLVVSIASLACQIYAERRKQDHKPDRDALIRYMWDSLAERQGGDDPSITQQKIIQVVAGEVIERDD